VNNAVETIPARVNNFFMRLDLVLWDAR